MGVERSSNCFACGKDNPVGLRLDIERKNGVAGTTFIPATLYEGYRGYTHGGIISTLLDEVIVWAATSLGIKAMSAEIIVRFKRPVPADKPIKIEGKITEVKERLLYGEASIHNDKGVLLATAEEKLIRVE